MNDDVVPSLFTLHISVSFDPVALITSLFVLLACAYALIVWKSPRSIFDSLRCVLIRIDIAVLWRGTPGDPTTQHSNGALDLNDLNFDAGTRLGDASATAGHEARINYPIPVQETHSSGTTPYLAVAPTSHSDQTTNSSVDHGQGNYYPSTGTRHRSTDLTMTDAHGHFHAHPVNFYRSTGPAILSSPEYGGWPASACVGDTYVNHVPGGSMRQIWYRNVDLQWQVADNEQSFPDIGQVYSKPDVQHVLYVRKNGSFATWIQRKTARQYQMYDQRRAADVFTGYMMAIAQMLGANGGQNAANDTD